MDVHKIGTFTNGRFTTLLDLNDGATISFVRGTFKVTPYQETAVYPKASRRYGGTRQLGEIHDNGQIQATWLLSGGSGDGTLAVFDDLVEWLESSRQDLFYLWRPDGATRNTYFDLRGGLPWEPLYSWAEFSGAKVLQVTAGWQVAPLALGDPLDIADDFSTDSIAAGDWTFGTGSGTVAVASGVLTCTTNVEKEIAHTGRGYQLADTEVTLKLTAGAAWGVSSVGVTSKRLDASNYLLVRATFNTLAILKKDGGSYTTLVTDATALAAGTAYWLRSRVEGNLVVAEVWSAAPSPLGTPLKTVSYTLAGADATKFGTGVPGATGFRLSGVPTDFTFDDFASKPYTYNRKGAQTVAAHVLDLPDVPGTAPALVDAYTDIPAGVSIKSALIGWASKPTATTSGYPAPLGLLEAEGAGGTSNAAYSGGKYLTTASVTFRVEPGLLPPDDFSDTISIEIWLIVKASGTGGATLIPQAVFTNHSATTIPIYTAEYGAQGLTVPTVAGRFLVRAGTITLPSDPGVAWSLFITTTGAITAYDCAMLVPARQRACNSTGQLLADADTFLAGSGVAGVDVTKVIRSDLSGAVTGVDPDEYGPDSGLSGQRLEFPPGDVTVLHRLGANPVASDTPALEDLATSSMAVHYAITPRYHLARSG